MKPNSIGITTVPGATERRLPDTNTATRNIRDTWMAAGICAALTMMATWMSTNGIRVEDFSAWSLPGWWPLDVALVVLLAVGIGRKSRLCAVAMLGYFLTSRGVLLYQDGSPAGILLALMFGYCFWRGAVETFTRDQQQDTKPSPGHIGLLALFMPHRH